MKRKTFSWVLLFVPVIVVVLTSCCVRMPNNTELEKEKYAVLSVYIGGGLTGESHSLGEPTGTVVILNTTASSDAIQTRRGQYLFLLASFPNAHRRMPISFWTSMNFLLRNLMKETIQPRFALGTRYVLVDSAGLTEVATQYPESYGYLTYSRIGFNRDRTEAVFYTEHLCGLCGGGGYVLMRKIDGKWIQVAGSGTWIS